MSMLEIRQSTVPETPAEAASAVAAPSVAAPYREGDRIRATSPEGMRFLARVEAVTPNPTGDFTVLAAVVEPRKFRSHLLTTVVDANGFGPAVRPSE